MRSLLASSLLVLFAPSFFAQVSSFEPRRRILPDQTTTNSPGLLDLTGDGIVDLAFLATFTMQIVEGDGEGRFRRLVSEVATGAFGYGDHEFADFDGDGDLDLIVARVGSCFIGCTEAQSQLFLNDGTGTFTEATAQIPVGPTLGHPEVAAADVDADGDVDIIMGRSGIFDPVSPTWALAEIWTNDGFGNFVVASTFGLPTIHEPTFLHAADLDGDGAAEVVYDDLADLAGSQPGNLSGLRVRANDGTGNFGAPVALASSLPEAAFFGEVGFADVNGDGREDIVAVYYGFVQFPAELDFQVFLNDGLGNFSVSQVERTGSATHHLLPGTFVAGDFDADGALDLLVSGSFDGRTYFGDGAGGFVPGPLLANWSRQFLDVGADVDGDGDGDVLRGDDLFLADASGNLVLATDAMPRVVDTIRSATALDADGDGDLDIGSFGQAEAVLMLNDGAGRFEVRTSALPDSLENALAAVAADLNGDGTDDLVVGAGTLTGSAQVVVMSGGVAQSTTTLVGTGQTTALALGDVDNDGDQDIVQGISAGQDRLYVNDGSAGFSAVAGGVEPSNRTPAALALADFDGDGSVDLYDGSQVLRNVNGTFQDTGWNEPLNQLPTPGLGVADLNADGFLDLVLGTTRPTPIGAPPLDRAFLGDGLGNFSDLTTSLGLTGAWTTDVAITDLDVDGDPDIVWSGLGSGSYSINDGLAGFTRIPDALSLFNHGSTGLFADFDGDGDLDHYRAGQLANLSRQQVDFQVRNQLNARGPIRIGRTFDLEVAGPASNAWIIAWSPGESATDLGALGTLRLDPMRTRILGTGLLDGLGRDVVSTALPSNLGLVGRTFYTQALIGNSLSAVALTNRETLPITDL